MTDFDELRRLAQAATPGPWDHEAGSVGAGDEWVVDSFKDHEADAAFIAAANPATVIALLDERDELRIQLRTAQDATVTFAHERDAARADLAAANARLEMWWKELENANGVRDKYKAENAALRERITELENQPYRVEIEQTRAGRSTCRVFREGVPVFYGIAPDSETHAADLQARIDKALALADEWTKAERRSRKDGKSIQHARDGFDCASELRAALAADTPTTATAEGSVCSTCGDTEPTGGDVCCYHACPVPPATAEGSDQ
jgi:hypothetical protein